MVWVRMPVNIGASRPVLEQSASDRRNPCWMPSVGCDDEVIAYLTTHAPHRRRTPPERAPSRTREHTACAFRTRTDAHVLLLQSARLTAALFTGRVPGSRYCCLLWLLLGRRHHLGLIPLGAPHLHV